MYVNYFVIIYRIHLPITSKCVFELSSGHFTIITMIADNGEQFRTKAEPFSPRSSPRRQDTTGTLKTTITLGKNPSIVHSGPFYLMKEPASK